MTRFRVAGATALTAAALTFAALTAGCGTKTPDYQSVWTTSGGPTTAAPQQDLAPVGKFLDDKGVTAEPVAPADVPGLTVSIPIPPGWQKHENPKLPPTTEVIGKGDKLPRAVLTVFRLTGDFDPAEAVQHGLADAALEQNFTLLDTSTADFNGYPSSMVQGSHDLKGQRLHSWFRMVIPTAPDNQRYLVQLTISTLADQAAAQAADIEKIMKGFTVAAK